MIFPESSKGKKAKGVRGTELCPASDVDDALQVVGPASLRPGSGDPSQIPATRGEGPVGPVFIMSPIGRGTRACRAVVHRRDIPGNLDLKEYLIELGFKPGEVDIGQYYAAVGSENEIWILVYVDDIIFASARLT